ncbi:hemagglutinin repeat-containing protein [Rheinheimera sp. YQF-2]|uniref:Hemagglutinin repeat-containing protein n=1 Tax=Rheinheimera lutimaris TaxID=2740584 RepID=A0A7Y5EIR7_9GAMM|nr:hemagglutinin repeat-containing protein [Rheinheimera lutimaris]NRQ43769.1 hemagglutinin repeat-containing protein [Rheinheimera lutimaris]
MFSMKWRLVVARTLVIVLAGNPLLMAAHGIERSHRPPADFELTERREQLRLQLQATAAARAAAQAANNTAQLAAGQQAAQKHSANGTDVIDIAAPGQSGVSHNQFMQFNVTADGLILNNSQGPALSALGGWTDGNRRLAAGTARLILAEVTGSGRSSLLGYTEVLGDSAEFVLANPNGISCNGCGFINTPRVVLATGIPDLLNGNLLGINISGGDVAIDGAGLNASNVNKFDILTRAMTLNAALYANELNIRTGSNYYDYQSLQAQANANQPDSNPAYQFALDASALGAMYANSISLIGTEAGLGVRSKGLISSVDSLQLTADGRLELKDTIAGGELALRSQRSDIITNGSTYGQTVNIAAAGTLQNSGLIAAADTMQLSAAQLQQSGDVIAGINQQGQWQDSAAQQLNISGTAVNQGRIISRGTQQLTAKELQNSAGALLQGDSSTLTTTVFNNSGTLNSSALTLDSATVSNAGHIQAQQLSINAEQFSQTAGAVYQTGADGRLSVTGRELQLDGGVLVAEGSAQLEATGQLHNSADWLITGDSTISTAELSNSGTVQLQGAADLTADSLNNSGNMLFTAEQATALNIKNTLDNQGGLLQFGNAAVVTAAEINNDSGQISHTGSGTMSLQATQQLNNAAGQILSNGTMQVSAAELNNQQGILSAEQLTLTVGGDVNNQAGTIRGTTLSLDAQQLNNGSGIIAAAGQLQINAVALHNNAGEIYSAGRLNISGGNISNAGGALISQSDLQLNVAELDNSGGTVQSAGAMLLHTTALDNRQGRIAAEADMQLAGTVINNHAGTILGNTQLDISALQLNNDNGNLIADTVDVQLSGVLSNNTGLLQATNTLTANAAQIDNSGGSIQATSALLSSQQSLNNSGGTINAQALALSTAALDNSYGVILASDSGDNALQLTGISQLTNDNGTVASHGNNWQLVLDNLSNDNGKLLHLGSGTFTLSQAGTLSNSGTIAANVNLVLNATDVVNSGTLQAQQHLQLNAGLSNQAGAVLVANDITVNAPDRAISNAGSVSANNSLQLAGASLHNSHLLYGGNSAVITAADVENSGTLSAANLDVAGFSLLQNSGRIESNAAAYSGDILDNQSGAVLINAGNSANGLQLNVAQLSNSGTVHNSSLDMSLGGNLSNSGSIIHAGLGSLLLGNNGSINNAGGSIASAGTANIQNSIAGAGTVYAEQGMQLSSSGTFVNNSQLYSKGDILVTSALHNQGGSLLSDANLTIDTSGNVTNSGTLQGQNLSLTSAVLNNNAGTITSTGTDNAQISATSLSNNSGVIQATNNNFSIITRSGELNNSNGQINHSGSGSLTLNSASHLNQQAGTVQSAAQLLVNAQGNLNNSYGVLSAGQYQLTASGGLNNNDGRIVSTDSSGSSSISSAALTNRSGHIAANGTNLTLNAAALDNNNGSILLAGSGNLAITAGSIANDAAGARIISNGAISLSGGTLLRNAGQISAANLLTVNAATLTNSGTLASRSGKVDIDSSGTLTNSGTVSGANGIDIDVRTLNNSAGLLQSDGLLDIAVNSLSVGRMQARDIALDSKSSIALQSGEHISAGRNINLHSDANISNSGTIVASGTLDISGKELTNNSVGVIRAGGNAVLDLNKLTNDGIVSSSSVLTLDVKDTTNNGTLAAGSHLDINGNINNRNLVFAGSLLTIDGNVDNTANIYSNQDAIISGTTVTNTGGSIAAAQDLSISGTILNDHTGTLTYTEDRVTQWHRYPNGEPWAHYFDNFYQINSYWITYETGTSQHYEAQLNGKVGVIAAGRNLSLHGNITNNYSTISAGQDISLTGTSLKNYSATNKQVSTVTVKEEEWDNGCMLYYTDGFGEATGCAEPGNPEPTGQVRASGSYEEITFTGGGYGTIVAGGNITGNLTEDATLGDTDPLTLQGPNTNANGSSGSASRGNSATANSSGNVVVNRSSGNAKSTGTAERAASGVVAGSTGSVNADWHDNNAKHNTELTAGSSVIGRQQVSAVHSGISIQSAGFATLNVGNSLSAASANAPAIPQQQGGGAVGNGNIAGSGGYNPDLIIKGLVDNQQGTLTAQKGSAQQSGNYSNSSQPAGQNVFITDEQMRVLTEDLGFDANAINQGQQGLYAAISQNDLLADGVTLSAGGTIDITADGGFNINSGIAAGEGLILRSENGLEMGNFGFFDSDKLLGLQLGGDFTNNMNQQSDTLWLDIGGNFTNQGSLTGSDILSISAGKDLINQNLLSGGKVILDAGGDIINRVEFSQHTVQNGNNSTTYTTVGKAPQIISNDSLSMTAGNNIDLQGSKFSAAGDISLNAGNDVLLGAVEKLSGHEKYFKGGHDIELNRTYDVVSFDAGGNLSVVAGNNLQSEGAQFNAGGIAALAAGNEMNLLAVVESHYDADKTTKKSTFKKKVTETVSMHEEVQGTNITAANILLNATVDEAGNVVELPGGNITLVGGELDAEQNIIAYGKDITVTAGTYQDYDYSHTSKSSFGGLKSKSREELAQDDLLAGSTLTAEGNILLNADNNLTILASELNGDNIGLSAFNEVLIASGEESSIRESRSKSGGFLSGGSLFSSTEALNGVASTTADSSVINATGNIIIDAGSATVIGSVLDADKGISVETDIGDIQVLAAKETTETYQYRKEMNVGFGDVAKVFSDPAGLLKDTLDKSKDSGRISLTIANADYLESETRTNSTQHKGSEIKAGAGVTFDSIGNINIEGSHIEADTDGDKEGALSLTAGGNVRVADVTDTYSETNKTTTGSAEVNVMVTHQAAEVAQAAVAVKDAAEQLENTRRNYKTWMQQQDTLKATLTQLETELAQGKPGVNQGDIDDLRNQIDMLRTDEAWHLANIAVASDNLVTATVNLADQSITGAASSTTWGFNGGLELDINASVTENQLLQSTSVGSSLSGAGVSIKTGSDSELAITGSTIDSTGKMVLDVGSLNMQAGVSTLDSQSQSKQGNINVSQTVWGAAAGGPSISGSLSMSEQRDHSTTYTNAGLSAAETMDITTQGDASLVGANILADKGLTASIGGDLTLQSVQNLNYGSNHGAGISGGMSFDGAYTNEGGANADPTKETRTTALGQAGDANSANGGVNVSNGRYYDKETVLSSITSGGPVDINVNGHTGITGALIASVDENGNDTGNLNLNTGSLSFEDLTNTHYNTSSSVALNVSTLPGDNTTAPPKGVTTPPQDSKGEDQPSGTTNLGLHSGSNYDKGKTLATIGNGNITVGGKEAEPEGLNRDVDAVDKELYSIERTKADLDLTVKNQTLKDAVDAVSELASLIDSFNKKSPEESAAIMAQVKHVTDIIQQLRDSDNPADWAKAKEFEAMVADLSVQLVALQEPLPEEEYRVADAPPMPEKSFTEQQSEFEESDRLHKDYYDEGQKYADENLDNAIKRGEYAALQNETIPGVGNDIDFDGAINFYQDQRESAYSGYGLNTGAAEGGLGDFIGWTAASVTNESWQAAQFLGKTGAFVLTLGSTSSPLDGSGYHSLIGDGSTFGSPQTFAGAVGIEQGVIASYFAGVEGIAILGLKIGAKSAGAVAKVDDVGKAPNTSGTKFGPHEEGPLGNSNDLRAPASTFRSGSYTEKVADTDQYFYRDYGGDAAIDGRYWTPEQSAGPLQSQLDSAVLPEWGNTFLNQAVIKVPKGTKYYEGPAAPQTGTVGTLPELHGGGIQIFLPNPNKDWIIKL